MLNDSILGQQSMVYLWFHAYGETTAVLATTVEGNLIRNPTRGSDCANMRWHEDEWVGWRYEMTLEMTLELQSPSKSCAFFSMPSFHNVGKTRIIWNANGLALKISKYCVYIHGLIYSEYTWRAQDIHRCRRLDWLGQNKNTDWFAKWSMNLLSADSRHSRIKTNKLYSVSMFYM